ncbi:MAG: hypothetical protein LUG60_06525 [Erysipelotrichaceae bacterium]|nr:hypothetical protein [Erysipelotrichaceae bacterium]
MNYYRCFFALFKSKRKIALFIVYFIAIIVGVFIVYHSEYGSFNGDELNQMKAFDKEMGLDFFYLLQDSGLTLIMFFLTCIILSNIISSDFLSYNHNKFDHFLIVRMSTKQYNKISKIFNFSVTFIVILLTHLITLMIIHLFCFPISFSMSEAYFGATRQTTLFSNSMLISLIIYILLSSIGYGIFSNFIYALQSFVKNIYLYRTLGILLALILYIGSSVVCRYVIDYIGSTLLATIAYFINIINIITPGIIQSASLDNHYILFYIGSLLLYSLLTSLFFDIKEKHMYEYNQ